MKLKNKKLIIFGISIVLILITLLFINYENKYLLSGSKYELLDIEKSTYYSYKSVNTISNSYHPIKVDEVLFIDFINQIKQNNILNINSDPNEVSTNHFFIRGFKRYRKPFFYRLFSYNYWYIVVAIESIVDKDKVDIVSRWYEGNKEGPVNRQNYNPEPMKSIKLNEKEIHTSLGELIEKYQ